MWAALCMLGANRLIHAYESQVNCEITKVNLLIEKENKDREKQFIEDFCYFAFGNLNFFENEVVFRWNSRHGHLLYCQDRGNFEDNITPMLEYYRRRRSL